MSRFGIKAIRKRNYENLLEEQQQENKANIKTESKAKKNIEIEKGSAVK